MDPSSWVSRSNASLHAPGAISRASSAGSARSTTSAWGSATSSPRSAFLLLAGVLALIMRLQLARPESGLISADRYNQIFTMHGTTMMFLFAVPVMEAFAIYLVPLMIGTRAIAFPRLNAFSYWLYLAGGLMLWVAFVLNIGPGRRLVRVHAAVRPRVLARQARRFLGADDHLYRSRRACGGGRDRRDDLQAARARHAARSDAAVRLGHAGDGLHGHLRDARSDARVLDADRRPPRRHAVLQPRRRRRARSCGSTCSGSSAIPRSTSSSSRASDSSARSPRRSAVARSSAIR